MAASCRESRAVLFQQAGLRIEGSTMRAAQNLVTEDVFTPTPQLLIPLRGSFSWRSGSSESLITANHLLLMAGGNVSRDRFHDDQPLDFLLLSPRDEATGDTWARALTGLFAKRVASAVGASTPGIQHAASALWCVSRRADAPEAAASGREEAAARLMRALAVVLAPDVIERGRRESRLIEQVRELIGDGSRPLSLTQIARELGRSPAYLTDAFRRCEGVSIGRYQRRLRLSRALMELRTADDLTALALDLGFASHAHFSAAFKAAYGETPSRYRARVRGAFTPVERSREEPLLHES